MEYRQAFSHTLFVVESVLAGDNKASVAVGSGLGAGQKQLTEGGNMGPLGSLFATFQWVPNTAIQFSSQGIPLIHGQLFEVL